MLNQPCGECTVRLFCTCVAGGLCVFMALSLSLTHSLTQMKKKKKNNGKGKGKGGGLLAGLKSGNLPYDLHEASVLEQRSFSLCRNIRDGVVIAEAARCRCTCKENLLRHVMYTKNCLLYVSPRRPAPYFSLPVPSLFVGVQ